MRLPQIYDERSRIAQWKMKDTQVGMDRLPHFEDIFLHLQINMNLDLSADILDILYQSSFGTERQSTSLVAR